MGNTAAEVDTAGGEGSPAGEEGSPAGEDSRAAAAALNTVVGRPERETTPNCPTPFCFSRVCLRSHGAL